MYYIFTSYLPSKEVIEYKIFKKEKNKVVLQAKDGSSLILYKMVDGLSILKKDEELKIQFKLIENKKSTLTICLQKQNTKMEMEIFTRKLKIEDEVYKFEYDLLDKGNLVHICKVDIKGVKENGD
jgi:hypothetical protein